MAIRFLVLAVMLALGACTGGAFQVGAPMSGAYSSGNGGGMGGGGNGGGGIGNLTKWIPKACLWRGVRSSAPHIFDQGLARVGPLASAGESLDRGEALHVVQDRVR